MIKLTIAGLLAACILVSNAGACEALVNGPKGRVAAVADGDTLRLDGGRTVRLVGIQAPELTPGRAGFDEGSHGEEAKALLTKLALGKQVRLRYGGARLDRYGRALAQVVVIDAEGIWLQERMLALGQARVYAFPDNQACLADLFAAEERGRAAALGIWRDSSYSVRRADQPDRLLPFVGRYELVEGRVLAAEKVGDRVYLNFGRRYKEDFTAVIAAGAARGFIKLGLDPLRFADRIVRLRGWIDDRDGPRIEVTHPGQVELLPTP